MERKREDNVHWGMENARGKGKGMDSNIYCTCLVCKFYPNA